MRKWLKREAVRRERWIQRWEAQGQAGQNCRSGEGGWLPGAKRQATAGGGLATESEAPVGWSSGAIRATRHRLSGQLQGGN